MFCKNCGSEAADNAVLCLKCGCDPRTGGKFCTSCGVGVNDNQVACIKCGNSLETKKSLHKDYNGLYRSSDDKVILGLCGGLAHKLEMPVLLVRLIMFIILWFGVVFIYFVALFLPKLPTKNL
jgi:phage shock protein PspC (stress-responsive transcriptional regulator)